MLAVPNDSPVKSVKDLQGKRIATELVEHDEALVEEKRRYCRRRVLLGRHGSQGAGTGGRDSRTDRDRFVAEGEQPADCETRWSPVYPQLIANKKAWADPWKRKKIETLALMLRGALAAEEKVGLKMNVPRKKLDSLLQQLPALRNPTISALSQEDWVAVETIIDERIVREIIPH